MSTQVHGIKSERLSSGVYEIWHQWKRVQHGHDALNGLPSELQRLGLRRALLVTTRSLVRQGEILARVKELVGERLVAVFGESEQHVPRASVLAATVIAREVGVNGVISLGGGSVIDTAKGVALSLAEGVYEPRQLDPYRVRFEYPSSLVMPPLTNSPVPHLALPSTLSGGEYSGVVGIKDEETGVKDLYSDPRLCPVSILLDPFIASATPSRLFAATGVKVIGDATEQLYSKSAHPVIEPLLLRSIRWLADYLPRSLSEPEDADVRLRCLVAAWMGMFGWAGSGALAGIGAGLRHQLGALYGVPHGEATCVLLPHVLRYNLPAAPRIHLALARALGLDPAPKTRDLTEPIAGAAADLVRRLSLPTRLRDVGVGSEGFDRVAANVLADFVTLSNPRAASRDELVRILDQAL